MSTQPHKNHPRAARSMGGAMLFAFVLGVGFFLWKAHLNDASHTLHARDGAGAFWRAIRGESSAWEDARDAYRRAAAHSITDPYPVFCIAMVDRMEDMHIRSKTSPNDSKRDGAVWEDFQRVHVHLSRGRLVEARETLIKLGPTLEPSAHKRLQYHMRLLTELESASLLLTQIN